jgi:hypothetical protein
MRRVAVTFALSVGALALSLPAHAGTLTRTFVSSTGLDSNPCTTAAPCASFAAAYAAVAPNGIVAALDPGKYGPLAIAGSVTIDGNGWAAITVPSSGPGIGISAGTNDVVVLRGLTIDGGPNGGGPGILFSTSGSLTVTGCVVRNLTSNGLTGFSNGTQSVTLAVEDTHFINTGTNGVYLSGTGTGALTASFVRTEFTGNGVDGLQVDGTSATGAISITVTDSVAANNSTAGFEVDSDLANSVSNLSLTEVEATGNGAGVIASGSNATLWLAKSTVAGNAGGGFQATGGGIINSFGDNSFAKNGANSGSLGTATKQ